MLLSLIILLTVVLSLWLILVNARREPKAAPVRVFIKAKARSRHRG